MDQIFKDNIKKLKADIKNKPLVLFLGAGVNANLAPVWDDLLEGLIKEAILRLPGTYTPKEKEILVKKIKEYDVYAQALIIKKLLGNQYLLYLQHQIYGKEECMKDNLIKVYKKWKEKQTKNKNIPEFLFSVAELCQNEIIQAVVTYNYDEYLSILINEDGIREAQDVFHFQQQKPVSDKKLLIYHVHGFIPSPQHIIREDPENIVLAYDEYFQNMLEPFSWQTTSQLHFLMNYTCLFLGTSLNDINMLRILSYAKKYSQATNHYALFKESSNNNKTVSDALNLIHTSVLDEVGIHKVIAGKEYSNIYEKVKEINNTN